MRYLTLIIVISLTGCIADDREVMALRKELKAFEGRVESAVGKHLTEPNGSRSLTEHVALAERGVKTLYDQNVLDRVRKLEDAGKSDGLKDDQTIGDLKLRVGNLEDENKSLKEWNENDGKQLGELLLKLESTEQALTIEKAEEQKRLATLESSIASLQEELTALKAKGLKSKQPTESLPPVRSPKAAYSITQGRSTRGIVLTGKNCVWCRKLESDSFPQLRNTGWLIGTDNTNNIEEVDIDTEKGQAYLKELGLNKDGVGFGIPRLVRVVNGKAVSHHDGYLNAKELSGFFNGTFTPPAVIIKTKEKVA